MNVRWCQLNLYLALALACAAVCGCKTGEVAKLSKQLATLRLHIEVARGSIKPNEPVPIYRERPIMVRVELAPFITEANVAQAKVVEVMGGYALRIKFDHTGLALLEDYTVSHNGRRIAVFSQFGDKLSEARWLAAPLITRRISDGVLTFTPDASREECEDIALGLNNVAKEVQVFPDF